MSTLNFENHPEQLVALYPELAPGLSGLRSYDALIAARAELLELRPKVNTELDALVKRTKHDDMRGLTSIAALRNKVAVIDARLAQIEEELKELNWRTMSELYGRANGRYSDEVHRFTVAAATAFEAHLRPFYEDDHTLASVLVTAWPKSIPGRAAIDLGFGPWTGDGYVPAWRSLFSRFGDLENYKARFGSSAPKAA